MRVLFFVGLIFSFLACVGPEADAARASTVDTEEERRFLAARDALSLAQREVLDLAANLNGLAFAGDYLSVIQQFRARYEHIKAFNHSPLNTVYYRTLVEGIVEAISGQAEEIAGPLRPVARTKSPLLREGFKEFLILIDTLDKMDGILSASSFFTEEKKNSSICGAKFFIFSQLETACVNVHTCIYPLYGIEINALRKDILEKACSYNARAVAAGGILPEEEGASKQVLQTRQYNHALALGLLYQIPPHDTRKGYRATLSRLRGSLRDNRTYKLGMDALVESMDILDTMSVVEEKLSESIRPHVDDRYSIIFREQLQDLRSRLVELMGKANSVQTGHASDDDTLRFKITLLYSQLRSFVPSIISLRKVEISAPRPNDREGLAILWGLEKAFKDLIRLEKQGRRASAASAASASAVAEDIALVDIYRRYSIYFPYYQPSIIENALLLIRNGLFVEALDRLSILNRIQLENGKVMGSMGHSVAALCRGYMGDWGPYNAFRTERASAVAAKTQQKVAQLSAKAEKASAAAVAGITAARAAAAAEAQRRIDKAAKDERGATASSMGAVKIDPADALREKMNAAALADIRAREREEAAREKAAARAMTVAAEVTAPAMEAAGGAGGSYGTYAPMAIAAGAAAASDLSIDLTSLFGLKGTAKKVEDEIIGNTWRISCGDLVTYFTNLGCTIRQTGGSHQVVEIPEVTEILVDGQVAAVIPDEGGSGTLPNWDGDHFPAYLKSQIRALRDILARSAADKVSSLAAAQKAKTDELEASEREFEALLKEEGGSKAGTGSGGGKGGNKKVGRK